MLFIQILPKFEGFAERTQSQLTLGFGKVVEDLIKLSIDNLFDKVIYCRRLTFSYY